MKQLETEFSMNGMRYTILERSSGRYFASLHSLESGKLVGYETGRIVQQKESNRVINDKVLVYEAKERIINNEMFGKCGSGFECCMTPKNKGLVHDNYLDAVKWDEKQDKAKGQQETQDGSK